jgi:spermidine synthase
MADRIVFDGDTAMEHYQVIDTVYEGRLARVLYSGQRHTAQSGVARDGQPDLLFDYNQRFLELLESVPAKRLLLIGGGAFTLPMALLVNFPDLYVDVVEIDPGLTQIAERYFGLQPSEHLNIIAADGGEFLGHNNQQYDVILIDAFSHSSLPDTLRSEAAVQHVYRSITPDGIAAMNIIAPYYGPNNSLIREQLEHYSVYFRKVETYPAGRALFSLWLPQNLVLVTQKGKEHELHLRYGKLTEKF